MFQHNLKMIQRVLIIISAVTEGTQTGPKSQRPQTGVELISTRYSLREISCKTSKSALVKTQVDHIQVVKEPEKGKSKLNILSLNSVLLTGTCKVVMNASYLATGGWL